MLEAVIHRGADGLFQHEDSFVALGCAASCTTPESPGSSQLFGGEPSGLWLSLDGRVDNRDDLQAALGGCPRSATDSELVLRAYQRWGEESPRFIVGDFAYVIWDPGARRIFCARDHLGVRPLYYYTDGRRFLWASELRQLFQHPAVPRRPNEGMVAEYLNAEPASLEETLYQGIFRLPPAHFLVVEPGVLRKRRYWEPRSVRPLRLRSDQEYTESFHATFEVAVRSRLRSSGPVAAQLSGGVDSSCVVGMCQDLFRNGSVTHRGFETFSLVFPSLPCDESSYVRQAVDFWNLKSNELTPPLDPDWYAACAHRYLDFPDHPNFHMSDIISTQARHKGFFVILTGLGGDNWYSGAPQSRLRRTLDRLRHQSRLASAPALASDLIRSLRRRVRHGPVVASWIPDIFARRTNLADRLRKGQAERGLTSGVLAHCLELGDRASARYGVEYRHPFHDLRLIELALGLPANLLWRNGQTKFVLRRAMEGRVPETILQRATKAEFSAAFARAFECDNIASLFRSPVIAEQGWIDPRRLSLMYREFIEKWATGHADYLPHLWPLSMFVGIELWFRAAFPNGCRG